jgi:WD40 repeat protein
VLYGHSAPVRCLKLTNNGDLISGGEDGNKFIWDLRLVEIKKIMRFGATVFALEVLPNDRLASAGSNRTIKIWSLTTGELELTLNGHNSTVLALAALPNNGLVSAGHDKTIMIWNALNGQLIRTLIGHTKDINALVYLKASGLLVSGGYDDCLLIWNAQDGKLIKKIKNLSQYRSNVYIERWPLGDWFFWRRNGLVECFLNETHDYETVQDYGLISLVQLAEYDYAAGCVYETENTIWINNLKTGLLKQLEGHTKGVLTLLVLDDGRLASGSADQTIRIWTIERKFRNQKL